MSINENDLELLVSEALLLTESIGSAEFEVEEDGGTIILKGIVSSEEESRIAEAVARQQPGVVNVINEIKILNF